jgi:SAM-dependent methyltransferase
MDTHSPHPTPSPDPSENSDRSGTHPIPFDALIDTVAGDPPVPITVWRTARTTTDTGAVIGARLAYRLISAYSRPGEAVVDLTDGHALLAACRTGNRRHHPGWFTDVASLIIGPATPATPAPTGGHTGEAGNENASRVGDTDSLDPADLRAWFGDDLTDLHLSADSEPVEPPADGASLQGTTSLVVAMWPLDAGDAENRVRLAWLLTACARLLRPGGCLVLVVANPSGAPARPEDFSPISEAAATVGLGYLQHIAAVDADAGAEAFIYHLTDEELLGLAADSGQQWAVAHLRVHADLLVFSQLARPTATPKRRRRDGGEHRG